MREIDIIKLIFIFERVREKLESNEISTPLRYSYSITNVHITEYLILFISSIINNYSSVLSLKMNSFGLETTGC